MSYAADSFVCHYVINIRLETRPVTLTSNESRLISDFIRTFMKRIEEQRPLAQLTLPIS